MRIVFFTRYGTLGASSRYRFYQYKNFFESLGIECNYRPLFNNSILASRYRHGTKSIWQNVSAIADRSRDIFRIGNADLIVLQGEFLPYCPPIFERLMALQGIPYAVDFDDAIHHYYDQSSNWVIRKALGKKIKSVVRHAACVVVGNKYLANYATNATAKRTEIVPTVIDLDKYPLTRPSSNTNEKFRIGWIGSPGSSRYLASINQPISELVSEYECVISLVGAGHDHGFGNISPELRVWADETEVSDIKTFDVGIMPLPNDDWAKGKCGFKLIQYMACGKPVIASPVGANCDIVDHGVNGFLAETPEEWVNAVRTLIMNPHLARKMGNAGRKMVEQKYCLQVTAPRLAEIFKRCIDN